MPRYPWLLAIALVGCTKSDDTDSGAEADACPRFAADADEIVFDDATLGEPEQAWLTITNDCDGDTPLTVATELTGDAVFGGGAVAVQVAPGASTRVPVTFRTDDYDDHVAVLGVTTDDPAATLVAVAVSGRAAPDQDGDGSDAVDAGGADCDDGDALVGPEAEDIVGDGIDQDCDGGDACYADADGDGASAGDVVASADLDCDDAGESLETGDCDDADDTIGPSAVEVPADGVDQDCDGGDACYEDDDADGFGAGLVASADLDCEDAGESGTGDDCDDADPDVWPGAPEIAADGVDQDCDGAEVCFLDGDGDGDGSATTLTSADLGCAGAGESARDDDCDDTLATVFAGAAEIPADGVDQDCDGADACHEDADGDGFGTAAPVASADLDCDDPGESPYATDCDDGDAGVHPTGAEVAGDGIDQDCDGGDVCYADGDLDGYGSPATIASSDLDCSDAGEAATDGDCDDADASAFPGAPEAVGDGVDEDCDGGDVCYADADGDGFGATATTASADLDCADAGEAATSTDCDDASAAAWPGAPEVWYDGADEDCSGGDDFDQDGDGEDAAEGGGADCDDTDPTVSTAAVEARDLADNDCDGLVDETFVASGDIVVTEIMATPAAVTGDHGEYFEVYNTSAYDLDLRGWTVESDDGDGFAVSGSLVVPSHGYAVLGADADPATNGGVAVDGTWPTATFSLSSADSLHLAVGGAPMFDLTYGGSFWTAPTGAALGVDPVALGTTSGTSGKFWCAETTALSGGDLGTPGGTNDGCDNLDHDGDGVSVDKGDCDDDDAAVYPSAKELWNGSDDDCDGSVDELTTSDAVGYLDGDTSSEYLGGSQMGVGDVDGDGVTDILIGSPYGATAGTTAGFYGTVYVVSGDRLPKLAGAATTYSKLTFTGSAKYTELAFPSRVLGNNTGSSATDVVLGGNDYYASTYGGIGWALWAGPVTSSTTTSSASITVTGYGTSLQPWAGGDLDGDGYDEVAVGNSYDYVSSSVHGHGYVTVFDTSSMPSGKYVPTDADYYVYGTVNDEDVGSSVAGGDLDGDGYDDLMIGASGEAAFGTGAGAIYVHLGAAKAPTGKQTISVAADFAIQATAAGYSLGAQVPTLGDVDGDGATDLVVASQAKRTVYVFEDTTSLPWASTSTTLTAADLSITGTSSYFGTSVSVGDMTGDGFDDLVVGDGNYYATGNAYLFSGETLVGSATWKDTDAAIKLTGNKSGDYFGAAVLAADVDADGRAELAVGASRWSAAYVTGRVMFFDL